VTPTASVAVTEMEEVESEAEEGSALMESVNPKGQSRSRLMLARRRVPRGSLLRKSALLGCHPRRWPVAKGNLHHTSSRPVWARGAVYESWPHPIQELRTSGSLNQKMRPCVYRVFAAHVIWLQSFGTAGPPLQPNLRRPRKRLMAACHFRIDKEFKWK